MLTSWLSEALATATIGQAELARLLTEKLGRSIDRAAVNKMLKGVRRISADELLAIGEITRLKPPNETDHRSVVTISGVLGAGGDIDTNLHTYYDGDVQQITLDIPVPSGIRAFEVWGNSMLPKYDPGDIVLIEPGAVTPEQVLGDVALVVTSEHQRFIKRVMKGSEDGLYNLESFNAPTMTDRELVEVAEVYAVVPRKQVRRQNGNKEINRRYKSAV